MLNKILSLIPDFKQLSAYGDPFHPTVYDKALVFNNKVIIPGDKITLKMKQGNKIKGEVLHLTNYAIGIINSKEKILNIMFENVKEVKLSDETTINMDKLNILNTLVVEGLPYLMCDKVEITYSFLKYFKRKVKGKISVIDKYIICLNEKVVDVESILSCKEVTNENS